MLRRFILTFAALAGTAASAHAATYKIHWLLGHKNLDYFEEAARSFKTNVEKASKGEIAVVIEVQSDDNVNPASQPPEIAAKVASGEAEMGHSFADVLGKIDPQMYAFEDPYLFRGYRHLEGVFEGPVGAQMLSDLRAHGVQGLSFTYSGGAQGVASIGREIRRPEDLKGLRVGVFGDAVNAAWLERLGAKPVPIGHELGKIAPMAKARELDAVVTTWRNFDRENLAEAFTHQNMAGSTYLVSVTYVNPKFFGSLPKQYQELLTKAAQEASRIERRKTIELNEQARRFLVEGRGIQAVHLSAQNQQRFVDALNPAQPAVERVVGKDLIERIRKTPDAPEHPAVSSELAAQ